MRRGGLAQIVWRVGETREVVVRVIEDLEKALRIALEAMQANISHATIKDEHVLAEAIPVARDALRELDVSRG